MKAILLAAGLGTRLRPITDSVPKPLVPILNRPLLNTALIQLKSQGFGPFAMNLHHLPEKFVEFLKSMELEFGQIETHIESPKILGTGGALPAFRAWIGQQDFLVYNGDILSGLDFAALARSHQRSKNVVTMIVRPNFLGKDRAVWVQNSSDGLKVLNISKDAPQVPDQPSAHNFACAYIAKPLLLDYLPEGAEGDLIVAFNRIISDGYDIGAVIDGSFWADVGTPQSIWDTTYALLNLEATQLANILKYRNNIKILGSSKCLISPSAVVDSSAELSGCVVIGDNCLVDQGVKMENTIIFPGAAVKKGGNLKNVLLTKEGAQIPIDIRK